MWIKYMEDYEFTLHYHPSKANVVVDALSYKSRGVLASVASQEWQMLEIMGQFGLHHKGHVQDTLGILVPTPSLLSRVIESQRQDIKLYPSGIGYK